MGSINRWLGRWLVWLLMAWGTHGAAQTLDIFPANEWNWQEIWVSADIWRGPAETCQGWMNTKRANAPAHMSYVFQGSGIDLGYTGEDRWYCYAIAHDSRPGQTCSAGCPISAQLSFHCRPEQGAPERGHFWVDNMPWCSCFSALPTWDGGPYCKPIKEVNRTNAPSKCEQGCGNPIYPLTGTKVERVDTGVELGGVSLLLVYDTAAQAPANQSNVPTAYKETKPFGKLWSSSFHRRLHVSVGQARAMLRNEDGKILNFTPSGYDLIADTDPSSRVRKYYESTYHFVDGNSGNLLSFDIAGDLREIKTGRGRSITFEYVEQRLVGARADDGRSIWFQYNDERLVTRVIEPSGQAISFEYDSNRNLAAVVWQDGRRRQFLYENTSFPWALTGISDENNSRLSTFTYDSEGRATSTEHAGGVNKYSANYGTAPRRTVTESQDPDGTLNRTIGWEAPSGLSITQPNGVSVAVGASIVSGVPSTTSRSQPAGSGAGASTSAIAYDAAGNVESTDDFSGTRTCHAYDDNKRETVRVEAVPVSTSCGAVLAAGATLPSGARKTTTEWYADLRKPVRVTSPLRRTTYVYHRTLDPFTGNPVTVCTTAPWMVIHQRALPLVCRKVEEALLPNGSVDTAVPAEHTLFTYDAAGRPLSSVNANGGTTTYAYHTTTAFDGIYDEHYAQVLTLVNMESGAGGSVDGAMTPRVWTLRGAAAAAASAGRFGGVGLQTSGLGDALDTPGHSMLNFGPGDFTIEGWVKTTDSDGGLVDYWTPGRAAWLVFIEGGRLSFYAGNWRAAISTSSVATGNWVHFAVTRKDGGLRMFINGVQEAFAGVLMDFSHTSPLLSIGREREGSPSAATDLIASIDDIRITRGVARYTAAFTPPAQPYAANGYSPTQLGHRAGDLQSVTNPAGHVTTYNLYDPAGRVRRMTDAKGVVTDITYTPRGWVNTVTVTPPGGAARTTTYSYDYAGQLTGTTQPDGTTVSYTYDAAHRMTGATDSRGNSVTYTLDSAGNRTAEEVRDPGGSLQRSIARSFDALNRLQQITGAAR